ncbi:MAG: hypothetical protein DI624_04545 [Brevundimonas sp.]|uniref:DEAD/DEAH box helicase n=1 Tax=Brevundimonas sp. TaxID=1871086 RepID=UPI000DB1D250|nr:DEAD/DEAH box helicase family protein [Brevundimonas sp.]PZT99703.1 MAG: hypothetical protein DI624_04545 [Brevundimonas sp.]
MTDVVHGLVALADYQRDAVAAIRDSIVAASTYQHVNPGLRQEVARSVGATLLQAPTGSGKTLMLGRGLEAVRGKTGAPCVWFWFAPFSGLVAQTRSALADQCPSLRLRDISKDRSALMARDGDVFVQTWALVATTRKDARKVRTRGEDAPALDDMLADLRDRGVRIGVVIDEAHLNFGASAKAAASFYLDVMRPDFTLLASATPNDEKLIEFETRAGVTVENRIIVSRDQVVKAGLNKVGLTLGVVRLEGQDAALIDTEQAALTVAWRKHQEIKARLVEKGIAVTPLMLVQVEDQGDGKADPVTRVRDKLKDIGIPESVIATHTSGEPDPDFHTLAYDPSREVLVFKVAVATGFDAPRAWTLVSVRPTRGSSFGLQIVGRIMRVHPQVRPIHGSDTLLDRGWVFLTDPELQAGLDAAANELKAVRSSIATVASELQVLEFTSAGTAALEARRAALPHAPAMPRDEADRQMRLDNLIAGGFVDHSVKGAAPDVQDKIVVQAEWTRSLGSTPLFGDDLPEQPHGGETNPTVPPRAKVYRVLAERGVPARLLRERIPAPEQLDGEIVRAAARAVFAMHETPLDYLRKTLGKANVSLRDLFIEEEGSESVVNVRMSETRISEAAQRSFEFNEAISARALKQALMSEFIRVCNDEGVDATDVVPLRRALDLFALSRPNALPDALKQAISPVVELADEIPPLVISGGVEARRSRLGAYEVFPTNMNENERRFAELLDSDESGQVKWWLRLQENSNWAVTLMLPSGKRFFPDFAVGVVGRRSQDAIALIETKDDGVTGRLHSDANREKIVASHQEYRNVRWTYQGERGWTELHYNGALDQIQPLRPFSIDHLAKLA